jgi:hypothetical protein
MFRLSLRVSAPFRSGSGGATKESKSKEGEMFKNETLGYLGAIVISTIVLFIGTALMVPATIIWFITLGQINFVQLILDWQMNNMLV